MGPKIRVGCRANVNKDVTTDVGLFSQLQGTTTDTPRAELSISFLFGQEGQVVGRHFLAPGSNLPA